MCHCNLLLFFCFLSVLCWCRRTQAKDQRSWKYALKTLPVPSGGCWAEIKKNKPFPLVFTVCCWELDFRGVSQPFKKISNWKYFFKKGEENLVKILNISSFFKLWDYMGHFNIYDLIKNSLGPALGPAVGVSSASLVSQPWSLYVWRETRMDLVSYIMMSAVRGQRRRVQWALLILPVSDYVHLISFIKIYNWKLQKSVTQTWATVVLKQSSLLLFNFHPS